MLSFFSFSLLIHSSSFSTTSSIERKKADSFRNRSSSPLLHLLPLPSRAFLRLPRENALSRDRQDNNDTMKPAALLVVAVAAIALSLSATPASASIHSYDKDYFYSVGDAYIFRGGREGLYASTKEVRCVIWLAGGWRRRERGARVARKEIKMDLRVIITRFQAMKKPLHLLARGKPFRRHFLFPIFISRERKWNILARSGRRPAAFIAESLRATPRGTSNNKLSSFSKSFPPLKKRRSWKERKAFALGFLLFSAALSLCDPRQRESAS